MKNSRRLIRLTVAVSVLIAVRGRLLRADDGIECVEDKVHIDDLNAIGRTSDDSRPPIPKSDALRQYNVRQRTDLRWQFSERRKDCCWQEISSCCSGIRQNSYVTRCRGNSGELHYGSLNPRRSLLVVNE